MFSSWPSVVQCASSQHSAWRLPSTRRASRGLWLTTSTEEKTWKDREQHHHDALNSADHPERIRDGLAVASHPNHGTRSNVTTTFLHLRRGALSHGLHRPHPQAHERAPCPLLPSALARRGESGTGVGPPLPHSSTTKADTPSPGTSIASRYGVSPTKPSS